MFRLKYLPEFIGLGPYLVVRFIQTALVGVGPVCLMAGTLPDDTTAAVVGITPQHRMPHRTEIKVKPGTADHRVIIFRLPADSLEGHIAISETAAFHQQTAWCLKRQGGESLPGVRPAAIKPKVFLRPWRRVLRFPTLRQQALGQFVQPGHGYIPAQGRIPKKPSRMSRNSAWVLPYSLHRQSSQT